MLLGGALFVGAVFVVSNFGAKNETPIDIDLIWLQIIGVEIWRALVAAAGLGASFVALVLGFAWLRGKMITRRYKKLVKKLEKEVHELRSLPLVGSDPAGVSLDVRSDVRSDAKGSSPGGAKTSAAAASVAAKTQRV
jgi:uncharacterized membrane protein YciS (DUF1049 family)